MVQLFVKFWLYSSSETLVMCRKKNRVLQVSVKKSNLAIFGFVLHSNHTKCTKKWLCSKKFNVQKEFIKNLFSLSIGPTIQAVSVKWHPTNFVPKIYLQFWQSFQVSVKFFAMFKTNSMVLKYLRRITQFKVFGIFHRYFVNTDLFCRSHTISQ